jgi:adenylate cyclase
MRPGSFLRPPLRDGKQELSFAEYRYISFFHWTCVCGAAAHIFFIFIFLSIGLNIMAYINIVSVAIFMANIFLIRRGSNLLLTGLLVILEVNAHAALACYFLGWDSWFQFYIFSIILAGFFYPDKKVSFATTSLSAATFLLLFYLFATKSPAFPVPSPVINLFQLFNGFSVLIIIGIFAYSFRQAVDDAEKLIQVQYDRAEQLLRNILPVSVGKRLKEKEQLIADGFQEASILFADLQNFTEFASTSRPEELVLILNELFSSFDDLLEPHGVEKIKTIGDAYMVASGLPQESDQHAAQITGYALDMLTAVQDFNKKRGRDFSVRIGINSGPVVAGVVGKKKYAYDLWGDTVNVAARMEASGAAGAIHITESTRRLIKDKFDTIKREPLHIKGKGLMQTYFLKNA